mmetsp:Transcript_30354/g.52636  ORF Transcript_30354/g.52636 Transcript_30354/m.52636 type:complete len:141 (+) Transcript_30354:20-442(+)
MEDEPQRKIEASNEDLLLTGDSISVLQNSVDRLAVNIFDALRLTPSNAIDEECIRKIQELAANVNDSVRSIEQKIDELPGIELTKEEQLVQIETLEKESKERRQKLFALYEQTESIADEARSATIQLADVAFDIKREDAT